MSHDRSAHTSVDSDSATVADLVRAMTVAEKAAQMTQVEFGSITPDEAASWSIGSVLSGGGGNPGDGSARAWRDHVRSYVEASRRSRLGIPIVYGTDAVHGHSNVLDATIFPHNIAMGATGDADLMESVARASSLETAATGARWTFAPCLAVPHDIRWGRTYEGFSQNTAVVAALGAAAVRGWQHAERPGARVLACAKHFLGEGASVWGTAGRHRHPWIDWWDGWGDTWQIDQGDVRIDEAELRRVHLPPFVAAVEAGALTIMACYNSWHGRRVHADAYLLTELLKGELGFEGFVVSDWMAIDQLDADYTVAVERAINAGVDMVMVPFDYERYISALVQLVESGRIPPDRIDDAVSRILLTKARIGLIGHTEQANAPDDPPVSIEVVGCDAHRDLARAAVSASTVVLTNAGAIPIPDGATLLAAGEALDDVGIGCGGWTISWAGSAGPTTSGRTILDGLRRHCGDAVAFDPTGRFTGARADVGVVSIHELPYVEGGGDAADLSVPEEQLDVVRRVRDRVDRLVVVVLAGRPLLLDTVLQHADAVVAGWLPGTEADGIADVLVGHADSTGTLPVAWPRHQAQISGDATPPGALPPWPIGHRVELAPAATHT